MISADTCVDVAAERLTRYRAALDSLAAHAFAGVLCLHGVSLAADCDECNDNQEGPKLWQ